SAARRARDALRPGRRAAAVAALARDAARDIDLDRVAGHRLLERQLELVAQVRAAIHLRPAAGAGAENVAEHVAENVAERVRPAEAVAEARAARLDAGMAEAVVSRPLPLVGEDFVGFFRFLELRLGVGIVRVAIRVVLHREATVRLLQLVRIGAALDAEHFVIVALRHSSRSPIYEADDCESGLIPM